MLYIILIFTIILIIIVLPFLLKREPKDNKSRRKKDVKISDAQKIEKEKTKRISFLEKIYTGEIDYKFEHIEMFWETRDVDFEKIMERILEKYDMTRALKFLELRVKLVDRATEKELNKLLKKENIDDHIDSIETNLKNKKSLSPGIKAEEIIVESNSRELVSVFKGIVHPVLYNFINGNPATKEYCASVMPFIDFPFKNRLLLGSFMNTTENHVVRYNSMSALLKLKSDKENIFRILHAYCKDEDVDKDSKAIAVRVMGQIPSKDVKKHLLHILDEAEIELKIAAALALGNFCEEDVAEKLIEASEDNDGLINAVSDSLKRMESVDISSGIVKQFENLDNKIKKTAMKLTQKLSLKKLIPYVRKLLTNPDLELKMLAGDFILDNDSVDDIELLLDYFKEIDEYLLEKAKKIKPKKNTFNENVGNNEKRAFYFANTMDNFFDEEELIASSIEAFKSSSKFVKATCVLKLIDCVDPKGMALINNALDDHDTYLVDAAINAISKRKSNDMDYLLVKKLNNVSKYNIVNLLNGIWTKKITVEGNLLNKFSKTKDQYVKLLVSNIRKLKT